MLLLTGCGKIEVKNDMDISIDVKHDSLPNWNGKQREDGLKAIEISISLLLLNRRGYLDRMRKESEVKLLKHLWHVSPLKIAIDICKESKESELKYSHPFNSRIPLETSFIFRIHSSFPFTNSCNFKSFHVEF